MIGKTGWVYATVFILVALGYSIDSAAQTCDGSALCAQGAMVEIASGTPATASCAETAKETGPATGGSYAVVSPVGKQTVPMIAQASRLATLAGRR